MSTDKKHQEMARRISELQRELDSCRRQIERLQGPAEEKYRDRSDRGAQGFLQKEGGLIDNERILAEIQKMAHVGSWTFDLTAKLLSWSDQVYRIFGVEPQEFHPTYEAFLDAVHPEDRASVDRAYFNSIREGREGYEIQHRVIRRNSGEIRYVQERCIHVRNTSGEIVRSIGMVQDITEQMVTEEALRNSESTARALLDALPEAAFLIGLDGTVITANAIIARRLGGRIEDILGKNIYEFLPSDVAESRKERVEEVIRTGKPVRFEDRRSGMIIDQTVYPVLDDQGDIFRVAVFARDVTECRRSQEALQESEKRFRDLVEMLPEAVFEADLEMNLNLVNKRALSLFGYTQEDMENGLNGYNMLVPEDRKRAMNNTERRLRGEKLEGVEYQGLKKDGTTFPVLLHASPIIHNGAMKGIRGVVVDMSERRRMENQLRQTQKMQAIGTLAGGIAHDFNNILTPVILQTELALLNATDDGPLRNSLQEVLEAGYRAKSLVKQILTFSREAEAERAPLVVAPIVKEALKLLRATLPTTIRIEKQLDEETGNVLADPTQIHQVLMNLCTNAAHAMREKGGVLKIGLSETVVGADDPHRHQSIDPGKYVKLTVADTGQGIDPSLKERIFEPFFTTKDRAEGTGIGLSVVHGIVESCGGRVSVESEPNEGTTFTVLLPSVGKLKQVASVQDEALPRGCEQVLVVDDETAMVKALEGMLTQLGYRVVCRTSSVEALEGFRATPDDYDLVITDQTMPNMTGVEFARALLEVREDVPIILCTGFSDLVDEEKAKKEGIKEYILKPIVMKEMAHAVRSALEG